MRDNTNWNLVLGSASPRRRELLSLLGAPFSVAVSAITETSTERDPAAYVCDIASQKAAAIELAGPALLLTADTTVAMEGEFLNKPTDRQDAHRMLRLLAGRTHQVYTGVVVEVRGAGPARWSFVARSDVTFVPWDEALFQAYLDTPEPYDKAGAYGIQGRAAAFVARVDGCYNNVVGLPLAQLQHLLQTEFLQHIQGKGTWQSYFTSSSL